MKRDVPMNTSTRLDAALRDGRCMALVDGRYMAWLLGQSPEATGEPLNRHALAPVLSALLAQWGVQAELQRVYWYSDAQDGQYPQDQVARVVAPHKVDGGASLLRAISADLKRLAERQACDHVLLASDDERLLTLMDEAQLHGLSVHVLADESARNLAQLSKEDPGWTRLLAQADRRIVLHSQAMRDLTQARLSQSPGQPLGLLPPPQQTAEDIEAIRPILQGVVDAWWAEEPEDLREDLREELQNSRGIPQEVDRHLLLRVRKVLERTLSFPEKKLLREMVRATVLGVEAAE
jgi:hypothetical protein